jgi:hypothetical protein
MTIDLYPEVVYDLTPDIGGDIDEAVEVCFASQRERRECSRKCHI